MGKYDRARNWLEMEAAQDITYPPKKDESWTDKLARQLGVLGVSPTEALQQGWKQGGQMSGRAGPFITLSTTGREIEKRDKKKDDQPFFPRSPRPPRFDDDDDDDDDEQTQITKPPKEPWQMTMEEFETETPPVEGYRFHGSQMYEGYNDLWSRETTVRQQGMGVFVTPDRDLARLHGGLYKSRGEGTVFYVPYDPQKILDYDAPVDKKLWERVIERIKGQSTGETSSRWDYDTKDGWYEIIPRHHRWVKKLLFDTKDELQWPKDESGKTLLQTNGEVWKKILSQKGAQEEASREAELVLDALREEGYDATTYTQEIVNFEQRAEPIKNTVLLFDTPTAHPWDVWSGVVRKAIAEGRDVPPEVLEEYNSMYVSDGPR